MYLSCQIITAFSVGGGKERQAAVGLALGMAGLAHSQGWICGQACCLHSMTLRHEVETTLLPGGQGVIISQEMTRPSAIMHSAKDLVQLPICKASRSFPFSSQQFQLCSSHQLSNRAHSVPLWGGLFGVARRDGLRRLNERSNACSRGSYDPVNLGSVLYIAIWMA